MERTFRIHITEGINPDEFIKHLQERYPGIDIKDISSEATSSQHQERLDSWQDVRELFTDRDLTPEDMASRNWAGSSSSGEKAPERTTRTPPPHQRGFHP